ncbi:Rv1733c family protein [Streptomyces luteogriseus]|uniref:Rv1733c family protein n=1 Tax=Streptomyces luteogriseus TaxID=68233 RepID=UPI00368A7969
MSKRGGGVWLWRWRRNPLKRRSDVTETWLGVTALAVLLLAAPSVGAAVTAVGERSALDRAQGLHRTAARIVERVPAAPSRFSDMANDQVRVTVRWAMSDGSSRTGEALVSAGSKAGSSTTVWLDDTGRLRPAPPTAAQARSQGAALGAAAGTGVCVLVVGVWWAARLRLDVRRGSQWDRAWIAFNASRGHRHA